METVSFNVPSITCPLCSDNIKRELGGTNGVMNISMDIKSQSVDVEYDPSLINPEDIHRKIKELGYEAIQ